MFACSGEHGLRRIGIDREISRCFLSVSASGILSNNSTRLIAAPTMKLPRPHAASQRRFVPRVASLGSGDDPGIDSIDHRDHRSNADLEQFNPLSSYRWVCSARGWEGGNIASPSRLRGPRTLRSGLCQTSPAGLEPATTDLEDRRAIQLRHGDSGCAPFYAEAGWRSPWAASSRRIQPAGAVRPRAGPPSDG